MIDLLYIVKMKILICLVLLLSFAACKKDQQPAGTRNSFSMTVSGFNGQPYSFSDYAVGSGTDYAIDGLKDFAGAPVCYLHKAYGYYTVRFNDYLVKKPTDPHGSNYFTFEIGDLSQISSTSTVGSLVSIMDSNAAFSSIIINMNFTRISVASADGTFSGSGVAGGQQISFSGQFTNMIFL